MEDKIVDAKLEVLRELPCIDSIIGFYTPYVLIKDKILTLEKQKEGLQN